MSALFQFTEALLICFSFIVFFTGLLKKKSLLITVATISFCGSSLILLLAYINYPNRNDLITITPVSLGGALFLIINKVSEFKGESTYIEGKRSAIAYFGLFFYFISFILLFVK